MKARPAAWLCVAMMASTLLALPLHGREIRGAKVAYDGLPTAKEGAHPVQLPAYEGQVQQVLVLSAQWLVVAVYDLPAIIRRVDELSGHQLVKSVTDFRESEAAGRPNWTAFKLPGKLHGQYLAQAREELGERQLDAPNAFTIASADDPAYRTARHPARATRTFVSLGSGRRDGAHEVDYAHYCILELPTPMVQGASYTIDVPGRGKATFRWDEMGMVSRAIKVNQAGYLPDAGAKFAYLGAFGAEFGPLDFSSAKEFRVVDAASGQVAFAGPVVLREKNPMFAPKSDQPANTVRPPMYGEDVYELDLGGLKAEGEFFITIPGVGRSWTFRHAKDAYGETFYTAVRGLFHQRAATALDASHTAWHRPKSTMHDTIYEADLFAFAPGFDAPKGFEVFDVVGGSMDLTRKTEDVTGGWYDAADWDRNQSHYSCVFDLLNAYDFAPGKFTDGQLNLPESGNGVPDLLDELEWGLECWRRSQDAKGGVSGFIEASSHTRYNEEKHPYAFSRRTRWASLIYAAAAAQYARAVKPFSAERSARYAESAKRAWAYGTDPANSLGKVTIQAKRRRGTGEPYTLEWEEKEEHTLPFRVHAASQLHRLTGDPAYLADIGEMAARAKAPFGWRFSHKDFSAWLYAELALNQGGAIPAEVVEKWRAFYLKAADDLVAQLALMPYRHTWPRHQDYWAGWGALCVTNFNRALAIAWRLTGEAKYRDAIINNTDFMLGANPLGMSWTTGIGYVYPIDIQHANSEDDGIMDPVPGITIYGLVGGPSMHYRGRELAWDAPGPDGKPVPFLKEANRKVPFYRCYSTHPGLNTGQCEFTVHETMASTIFSTAILLAEGWRPDDALKARKPRRDDLLFGYWPMP